MRLAVTCAFAAIAATALSCDTRLRTFPEVLTHTPVSVLANDGSSVYWIADDTIGSADGQTGVLTAPVNSQGRPTALHADTSGVYWVDESGNLLRLERDQSAVPLARLPPPLTGALAIAGNSDAIYVPGDNDLYQVRKRDGLVTSIFSQSTRFVVSAIAASDRGVCWVSWPPDVLFGGGTGNVICTSLIDGTTRTVATAQTDAASTIVMSNDQIFWIANGKVDQSAGQPNDAEPLPSLSGANVWPQSLQADDRYLYWIGQTAYGEGLFATDLTDSTTTLLVPSSLDQQDTGIMDAIPLSATA